GHARQAPDLRREHAASVDDHLGRDRLAVAALRFDLYAGDAAVLDADTDDAGVLANRGTPRAGPGGQGLRQAGRVEPAVGRQPDRAEDAVEGHQGELLLGLLRCDELQRQPECLGPTGLALELLEA